MSRFLRRHTPKTLDEYWWPNDYVKQEIELYLIPDEQGKFEYDNIFLYGPPGTGKSLLTKLLPEAMYRAWGGTDWDAFRKGAIKNFSAFTSEDRSKQIDNFRKAFSSSFAVFTNDAQCGIGIIDEMDDMVPAQKALLKNILDKFEWLDPPVILICTANTTNFPEAVQDRMHGIQVLPPSKQRMVDYGKVILKKEGAKISDGDLMTLAERSGGSMRYFINEVGRAIGRMRLQKKSKPEVVPEVAAE